MTLSIKQRALQQYLDDQHCDETEIRYIVTDYADEDTVTVNGEDLLILTEEEAEERCWDYILDSLWAFNASFIASHVNSGYIDDYNDLLKSISAIQDRCESANSAIRAMIGSAIDDFIEEAVSCDGRGHFLSSYDGNEYEACIRIEEKLEASSGHPTFIGAVHYIYIYRM